MATDVHSVITASPEIISHLISFNGEFDVVDFSNVIPLPSNLTNDSGYFSILAIRAAESACNEPLPKGRKGELVAKQRENINVDGFDDNLLAQYNELIKNKRETGYFEKADFASKNWGTCHNAYLSDYWPEIPGEVEFYSAATHPTPVMIALSRKFPDSVISVKYADEDNENNCGEYELLNGEYQMRNICPETFSSEEERLQWFAFARSEHFCF